MANAIVVLSGTHERIICDLQEVREGDEQDGKPICLIMIRPYTLNLEQGPETGRQEVQVRFNKWLPFSIDTQFKIPFSSVTCVGAVDPGLEEAYTRTVAQAVEQEQAQVEAAAAETGFVPVVEEVTDAEAPAV
jgi:hypothetical protein|tara:strand:+ start:1835 stop:2233 length:399 start_codon:yes stop_codon:yes gene_type:complete